METLWLDIGSFLLVFTLAIISPGPNFILVVNRSLQGARREGVLTALGVATGSGLFGFAGLVGLIVLFRALPHFALLLRLLGGGYLAWLGLEMILKRNRSAAGADTGSPAGNTTTSLRAWRTGLMTNLTNPKAWAFYLALFTVVMSPGFSLGHKIFLNAAMFLISFGWYASVALLVSSEQFRPLFHKSRQLIALVLGVLLLLLGGRILFNP